MSYDVLQGRPVIEVLPRGLKRITRFTKLNGAGATAANIGTYAKAYGTADVEFTTAVLVDQRIERRTEQGIDVTLVQVFQELAAGVLTPTNEIVESTTHDGRLVLRRTYVCAAAEAASLKPTIGSGSPAVFQVDVQTLGPVSTVTIYTIELTALGFVLSDSTQTHNNGKLLIRTIRTVGQAAATPDGFVLIDATQNIQDGYSTYATVFAKGAGRISSDVTYRHAGKLKITSVKYLGTDDGAAILGTLIKDDMDVQDGYTLHVKSYAEIVGEGLISQTVHARQDGLREVTNVSIGARIAPDGVIIRDDYQKDDGYTIYTVTAMQSENGGGVTFATKTFERYVPFVYPGRAKIFSELVDGGWRMYDIFRSPPVKTDVKAEVTVTYQTTATIGTVANYWNPKEWAWVKAEWVGLNQNPGSLFAALPGYRAAPADEASWTASVWAGDVAGCMMGNVVYGGTTARIEVGGGPDDPGGTTKTLDVTIEPAFQATDGTTYYRKVTVTADIPEQPALPR